MAKSDLTEFEQVELEFKKMQIKLFQRQLSEQDDKDERLKNQRERQVADFKKGEQVKTRRQANCKHRKGGKNNNFGKGDGTSYSINMNTYPDGRQVIMCTRCWKEVEKPARELKKKDPELYAKMWEEWKQWSDYPTDNSPSGGKIFEIERAA